MTNPTLTRPLDAGAARPEAPQPVSDAERYLFALLDSQTALTAALAALTARMAYADTYETEDIRISKEEINLEYAKLEARKIAYLSRGTTFKTFSDAEVQRIRVVLGELQGFTAKKERASAIVEAVSKLLATWDKVPQQQGSNIDPVAGLGANIA